MTNKYKIGFTAGTFDILNIGHITILRKAKLFCDYLIVAINTDELILRCKGVKPIMPLEERVKIISELKCVNKVVVQYNLVDINQFKQLKANVFIVGDDYKDRDDIHGIRWLKANNKVIFLPYTKEVSSSVIKERIIKNGDIILAAQAKRKRKQ